MHNKYATFVLPIVAGLAIVGAGFSTWVFGNTSTTQLPPYTGSVNVADEESLGPKPTIALGYITTVEDVKTFNEVGAPKFTLTLDQNDPNSSNGENDLNAGISFAWNDTGLNANGLAFQWSILEADKNAYSNYLVTVTFSVAISNSESPIFTYVENPELDSGTLLDNVEVSTLEAAYSISINQIAGDWKYKQKPQTLEAYQSMLTDLGYIYTTEEQDSYSGSEEKIEVTVTVNTTFTLKTN